MKKISTKPRNRRKVSICLTTYFDRNFQEVGSLCLKSIRKYAEKYGFDVVLFNKKLSTRPPSWNKILIAKKLLRKYDFVFWLDADAVFVRFDKDIRKEIEPGKDLYIVRHQIGGKDVPNTGSFIIRRSDWSRNFLENVWNKRKYIYSHLWENAALIDVLGYSEVINYNKYKIRIDEVLYRLDLKKTVTDIIGGTRFNKYVYDFFKKEHSSVMKKEAKLRDKRVLEKVKWLGMEWNSLPGLQESSRAIINHYPAKPYKERLFRMREDLKMAGLI